MCAFTRMNSMLYVFSDNMRSSEVAIIWIQLSSVQHTVTKSENDYFSFQGSHLLLPSTGSKRGWNVVFNAYFNGVRSGSAVGYLGPSKSLAAG